MTTIVHLLNPLRRFGLQRRLSPHVSRRSASDPKNRKVFPRFMLCRITPTGYRVRILIRIQTLESMETVGRTQNSISLSTRAAESRDTPGVALEAPIPFPGDIAIAYAEWPGGAGIRTGRGLTHH
jgi:hypothetical protein